MSTQTQELWDARRLSETRFEPMTWAVETLIPEGVTILAAAPKSGKSWLVLDWAIACATGSDAMGTIPCEKGDVLYASLEDTPRRMNERVQAAKAKRPDPGNRLSLLFRLPPINAGGAEVLNEWLDEQPKARMVILDVLEQVRGDRRGFKADFALMKSIKAVSEAHGNTPIVLVTHVNKKVDLENPTQSIAGSQGLMAGVDTIIVMQRELNSPYATLAITGKDVDGRQLPLVFDEGQWKLGDGADVKVQDDDAPEMSDSRRSILDAIEKDDQTPAHLAEVTGLKPNTVRQLLHKMVQDDQVERHGTYYGKPE